MFLGQRDAQSCDSKTCVPYLCYPCSCTPVSWCRGERCGGFLPKAGILAGACFILSGSILRGTAVVSPSFQASQPAIARLQAGRQAGKRAKLLFHAFPPRLLSVMVSPLRSWCLIARDFWLAAAAAAAAAAFCSHGTLRTHTRLLRPCRP